MVDFTQSGFEIVTTPTEAWLYSRLQACQRQILVASPYVNDSFLNFVRKAPPSIRKMLVTRTDLRDFAMGSSNLETLCVLAKEGVRIASLIGLHAKVYIFDNAWVLITSANATEAGLRSNWECGIAIGESSVVRRVTALVRSGLGADDPPVPVKLEELMALRKPVGALRAALPPFARIKIPEVAEPLLRGPFRLPSADSLIKGFEGWTRLTLQGVLAQAEDYFILNDMYVVCEPLAMRRYPKNRHVRDKIRQQLQKLRDLGLVEFLGGGNYRKTVTA